MGGKQWSVVCLDCTISYHYHPIQKWKGTSGSVPSIRLVMVVGGNEFRYVSHPFGFSDSPKNFRTVKAHVKGLGPLGDLLLTVKKLLWPLAITGSKSSRGTYKNGSQMFCNDNTKKQLTCSVMSTAVRVVSNSNQFPATEMNKVVMLWGRFVWLQCYSRRGREFCRLIYGYPKAASTSITNITWLLLFTTILTSIALVLILKFFKARRIDLS